MVIKIKRVIKNIMPVNRRRIFFINEMNEKVISLLKHFRVNEFIWALAHINNSS